MSTLKVDTIDTSDSSGNITVSRPLAGSGASLTALNATELTSGTIPIARIADGAITAAKIADGTVVAAEIADDAIVAAKIADDAVTTAKIANSAITDAKISAVAATKLTGTVADARFPATLPAASAANLTSIPAGNLTGSIADARVPASAVTQHVTPTDTTTIENNIAMLAFKVATAGSYARYNLVDQVADEFEDSSGIDASASTGESLISGYYTGAYEIVNSSMLDVTAVNGHGGSSEFYYGGGTPETALLDGGTGGGGFSPYGGADAGSYVKVDLGSGNTHAFTQARLYYTSSGDSASTWNVEWSTNNSSWTQVGTPTSHSPNTASHINWTWSSPGAKRYWRIKLTANASAGPWFPEIQFGFNGGTLPGLVTQNLTLQSVATSAEAVPTTGDMVMLIEDGEGTATINTDVKGYVSRDGGSNWTQGTLASEGSWGSNKKILTFHNLDISGQPSGTAMKYKITTHNQSASKMTRIHAVSLAWA